ncbi:unnamed protein product [Rhodiola kirilowii]
MNRLAMATLVLASILTVANGHLFNVFWNSHNNYTEWASGKQFFVDDWIGFFYDTNEFSVLEVNQTSYKNCIETNFIANITNDGKDLIHLTDARPYYFISGFGKCNNGVKLSINVESALSPGPTPHENASPDAKNLSGLMMFLSWAVSLVLVNVFA